MLNFLRFFLALALLLVGLGWFGQPAIAQEHEGCWMLNSAGQLVSLNGSVCLPAATLTPLIFSDLLVRNTADGRVEVSGTVTNRNSQPMPLVLVEYKLIYEQDQSQELLYEGIVPIGTTGVLEPGASASFSRSLNPHRLQQKPIEGIKVQVARYL